MKHKINNTFGIQLNQYNKGYLCYTLLNFTTENQFRFLFELIKNCFLSNFNLQNLKENIETILDRNLLV